jgi:hypothetical protein
MAEKSFFVVSQEKILRKNVLKKEHGIEAGQSFQPRFLTEQTGVEYE